jgi:sugar phosphate isomerase/epimerase
VIEYKKFKKTNMLLLSTDSLQGYGLNRIFELAKEAGYEGIDLSVNYGLFDTFNTDYIKRLIKEYDLPVKAVSAPKEISIKNVQDLVKMTKDIDAKVLILQPPKITNFKLTSWYKKEIPKLREKEFLSISLENAPAGTFLGFIPEHSMGSTTDLKSFKHISLDTARIGDQKKDLIRSYTSFKKYLVHIHLSNFHRGQKYALPEKGLLPLESFLSKLKQDKYPGSVSLKVLPKHLSAGEDEKVVEELEKAKKYFDKYYTNAEATEEN